jgi:transposase
MDQGFDVYCGLDVGKSEHHATALNRAGERLFDKPLPQDEARLPELFMTLQQHGNVLIVVDQPNTIGALSGAVARDCGCEVAYLPGLAMRKAADLYPGNSKTDARDAFIIAETARAMPHTLRAVDRDSEVLSALKVLSRFDTDLTHECTRAINRLRSLMLQIFPALERAFPGTILTRSLVLELLIKYAGPTGLRAAGRGNMLRWARNHSRKDPAALIDSVFAAWGEQTVTVAGTEAVELVIPRVAAQIKELKHQRTIVAEEVEKFLDDFPFSTVLMSMPGVGIKTAATYSWPSATGAASALRDTSPPTLASHRHTALRHLHPRRIPCPFRQQGTQERTVPIRMDSLLPRPLIQGLLRAETRRREETQRCHHLPRPAPQRRHLRHAQKRNPLPGKAPQAA